MRIVAVALAGDDEGVDDRSAVAGVGMADEEPVFGAELARADGVLDGVGVEPGVAVAQVRGQRGPVAEQIRASLAEAGLGQHPRAQRGDQPSQPRQRPGKVPLPERGAFIANLGLVPFLLERIEPADQACARA